MNKTITQWLDEAQTQLTEAGITSARLDAELLLAHTLRKPRTFLHGHGEEQLDARQLEIAHARLNLRLDRVPIAYIIGHKEFYGRQFKVTTATLIPRPESEDLIDLFKQALPKNASLLAEKPLEVVDVGTGSGCLGITAKLEADQANVATEVTLLDTSRHALNVAKENATKLQATTNTAQSDLLTNFTGVADIIIANLPYVDPDWQRSPETNHEPAEALFAKNNGLALIFELIAQTKTKLALGGGLILEADPEQHPAIQTEANKHGLALDKIEGYGLLFNKLSQ